MTGRRFPLWIVLGAVLVVALAVGSGVFSSAPPTPSQRAYAIGSGIRCPSCEDLSVADSSAPTAVTARATIRQLIGAGRTDQQIRDYLVARYGSAIVLEPPASGWSLLVWLLPLGGGVVAMASLALVLVRRRRAVYESPAAAVSAEAVSDAGMGPDVLDERRVSLEQSLADAYAEHRAGDLSDGDYQALRRRDTGRLAALDVRIAEVEMALAAGRAGAAGAAAIGATPTMPSAPSAEPQPEFRSQPRSHPRPRRPRRQRVFIGSAMAAFGTALILFVALAMTNRLPGQTVSGTITLDRQQQLAQTLAEAATLENAGQPGRAAQLYQSVLAKQPSNVVALAQLGWLEYQIGQQGHDSSLIGNGRAKLDRAVQINPGDYAARLYLGTVVLQQDHNPAGAVAEYRRFLAAGPPQAVLQQATPIIKQAFQQAGIPVPSQLAG